MVVLVLLLGSSPLTWAQEESDEIDIYDMDASNNGRMNGDGSDAVLNITNPYYSGCFHGRLANWTKPRVCRRDDDDHMASHHHLCRSPPFDEYLEIRIGAGNWDSATALGWLMQIILSEIVGVPTSIETGAAGSSRDFYDPQGRIENDSGVNPSLAFGTVKKLEDGDCRQVRSHNDDNVNEEYLPCAHFIPEAWGLTQDNVRNEIMEPPAALGVLGDEAWFVTKFTVDQHPELVSYHGLAKPDNRELLAELFKRPTTWGDYCTMVSTDDCMTADDVAQRAPLDETEAERMFVPGLYTGHFRDTAQNNCTEFVTNCTGHIAK